MAERPAAGLSHPIAGIGADATRNPETTPGMLVGRPDLSADVVLEAIAERLVFEGADPSKAAIVLRAARSGKPVARAFLRRLVLPPPRSALPMPVQEILGRSAAADRHWPLLRLVSRSR